MPFRLFFRDKIIHRTPVYDARTFLNFGRNFTNPGEKPFFLSKIAHAAPSSSSGGTQPNTKPSPSPQIKPRPVRSLHRALILPMPGTLKSGQQLMLLAGKTLYFFAVLLTGSGSHTAPLRLRFFISPHDAFCTVRTIWAIILHGAPSNRRVFPDKLAVTLESIFFKNCMDFFYCQIVLPVFDVFDRISVLERTFIIGI